MRETNVPVIVFQDENWLVVEKPYGMPTYGGDPGELGAQEWLELHLGLRVFVCSRLDKGTTGLLLFARTRAASALAEKIHVGQESQKTYYFLSDHDSRPRHAEQWTCEHELDGKSAHTQFSFEREIASGLHLYRALISRGRMHQIRRHAALSGCPLWGDSLYGGSPAPRIALHCAELLWPGIERPLVSPLPRSFSAQAHAQGLCALESSVAFERRGLWLHSVTDAWRVVQRGELSALDVSVDVYGRFVLVWVYDGSTQKELESQLTPVLDLLGETLGTVGVVYRRIAKNPHKNGLVSEEFQRGEKVPAQLLITEHGWKARITLTGRQHVGHFLDHRDNRRRVELLASGKRIANLFSYSCGYALSGALGGADVVVNVDASASALRMGKDNFALNSLTETGVGKFVEKDVRQWLEKQCAKVSEGSDPGWDIVICDPPTFSSTHAGGSFQVREAWSDLVERCASILKSDGVCFLSNNCQAEEQKWFEASMRRHFLHVQRILPPLDFPKVQGRSHSMFYECRK